MFLGSISTDLLSAQVGSSSAGEVLSWTVASNEVEATPTIISLVWE